MSSINRYTQGSVSQFNPLSMQEIMMVPTLQRQQHDQMTADAMSLEGALGQIDPHSLDFEEASKIRRDIEGQIGNVVNELDAQGVNGFNKSRIIGLKKHIANEMGPMGRLGQMHAYNAQLAKTREAYMKQGADMKQDATVVANRFNQEFAEHAKTPRFDANGKINNFTPSILPPEYIDVIKNVTDMGKSLGMSESLIQRAGESIEYKEGVGGAPGVFAIKSGTDNTFGGGSNQQQVNELVKYFNMEMLDPTSKTYKSMMYSGENPQAMLYKIQAATNSMIKTNKIDKSSSTKSVSRLASGEEMGYGAGSLDPNTAVNYDVGQTGRPVSSLEKMVNNMSATENVKGITRAPLPVFGKHSDALLGSVDNAGRVTNKQAVRSLTPKQKDELRNNPDYNNIANALIKKNPSVAKKGIYSVEALDMVKTYFANQKGNADVYGERVLSNNEVSSNVFASNYNSKHAASTSAGLLNRMSIEGGGMPLYLPDSQNKKVTLSELAKKNGNISKVEYHGMHNPRTLSTTGTVMDDFATITFDNKTKMRVRIPKSSVSQNSPEYKAAETFNKALKQTSLYGTDIYTSLSLPNEKVHIKPNTDGTFEFKDSHNKVITITPDELQQLIINDYE